MEIQVFVEPVTAGFRASTQSPIPLSAEGSTADEAVTALSSALMQRVQSGGQVRTIILEASATNGSTSRPAGVLTPANAEKLIDSARQFAMDPLFDQWAHEVEEYRRAQNTIPDPA